MPVNRRSFLKSGAMSVLTTALTLNYVAPAHGQEGEQARPAEVRKAPTAEAEIPFQAQQSPLYFFTPETFQPYVGGIFVARAGRNSIEMTLVAVRDCTPKATTKITTGKPRQTDCFALEFSAADTLTDLTTIYDVSHAALGEFPLFLTQRRAPRGKFLYEAVFNHVR